MGDRIKEAIEKMKAQRSAKPVEPVKPIPAKFEDDEDDADLEDDITPEVMAKEVPVDQKQTELQQQILMEIELLQNNGRYRVEMLHQMQEINKSLEQIGLILMETANVKSAK
jgi:predicted TIM-barrel fold metal-dependent hydrolase